MDINMDVAAHRFSGKQKLQYTNNSPDTLYKVFYHLYTGTHSSPGSMMDVRSRELGQTVLYRDKNGNDKRDWDGRVLLIAFPNCNPTRSATESTLIEKRWC